MKNLNFKNFNYALIDSAKEGYKEVLVTYVANSQPVRKILFVKEIKGKNNAYYISEAKKQIESQINSGALAKSASKQIKHAGSKGILKPALIALSVILGVGAVGTGGYFLHNYLSEGGGQGGGGGSYEPGDVAPAEVIVPDLPQGASVKADANAIIGQDYKATLSLNESKTSNGEKWSLPKALTKVSYRKGSEKTEITEYKYTFISDNEAELFIDKQYVLGAIDIELKLTPATPGEYVNAVVAANGCKVTYDKQVVSGQKIIRVRPNESRVTFVVELDEGRVFSPGCVTLDRLSRKIVIEKFEQSAENEKIYTVTIAGVTDNFNVSFDAAILPSTYITFDKESLKKYNVEFVNMYSPKAVQRSLPYIDLTNYIGDYSFQFQLEFLDVSVSQIPFAISVSGGPKLSYLSYDPTQGSTIGHITFASEIKEGMHITFSLIEPTDSPKLTMDEETKKNIQFVNESGESPSDYFELTPKQPTNTFYFKLRGEIKADPLSWFYSINGMTYEIENVQSLRRTYYSADINFNASEWVGYNIELHAVAPSSVTAIVAANAFNNDSCVLYISDKDAQQGEQILSTEEATAHRLVCDSDNSVYFMVGSTTKEAVITKNDITIEGVAADDWEFNPYNGFLTISNLKDESSFTIKSIVTRPSTISIDTSVDKDTATHLVISYEGTPLGDKAQVINYNVLDTAIYYDVADNTKVIESECYLLATTQKGEIIKIYGSYSCMGSPSRLLFNIDDLTLYKSFVLHVDVQDGVFKSPSSIGSGLVLRDIKMMETCGVPILKGQTAKIYLPTIKVYVETNLELTDSSISITSTTSKLTWKVSRTDKGSTFDYLITIGSVQEGDSLTISIVS